MANPVLELSAYEYTHLTAHLAAAGDRSGVARLLALETDDGRNAWFDAKLANADLDAFLADVRLAPTLAGPSSTPGNLALAVRCAMLRSSASSVANTTPPALVAAAVRVGAITIDAGWKLALARRSPSEQSETVVALASCMPAQTAQTALALWADGPRRKQLADVAAALGPRLSNEAFSEATIPALRGLYQDGDVAAFAAIAPHLTPEAFGYLFDALAKFRSSYAVADVVAAMAPHIPDALLGRFTSVLRAETFQNSQPPGWAALAPRLPPDLLERAMKDVEAIDLFHRTKAYLGLLPRLARAGQAKRAIRLSQRSHDPGTLLAALAPTLGELGHSDLAFEALKRIRNQHERARILSSLAPWLTQTEIENAAELAHDLNLEQCRIMALGALAMHLAPVERARLLREVLALARGARVLRTPGEDGRGTISATLVRMQMLARLIAQLRDAGDLEGAFEVAQGLTERPSSNFDDYHEKEEERRAAEELGAATLGDLLPDLDGAPLAWIIDHLNHGCTARLRAIALQRAAPRLSAQTRRDLLSASPTADEVSALGPYLPQATLAHVLDEVLPRLVSDFQGEMVAALAPHLERPLVERALGIVRSVSDHLGQAVALAALAAPLPPPERHAVALEALAAAQAAGPPFDGSRAQALTDIAPHLPSAVLKLAIADAETLTYENLTGLTLEAMLPALAEQGHLEEAWDKALRLSGVLRDTVLTAMVPKAPDALIEALLAGASTWDGSYEAARLVDSLCERLPESGIAKLARGLLGHEHADSAACMLAHAIARTPPELDAEIESVARAAHETSYGAIVLARLAARAPHPRRAHLLDAAIDSAERTQDHREFAQAVAAIAAAADGVAWTRLRRMLADLPGSAVKAEALDAITPFLPEAEFAALAEDTFKGPIDAKERPVLLGEMVRRGRLAQTIRIYPYVGVACQVRVLEHLGSEAPDELLAAALREARAVRGSGQAAWLLERLAPLVPRHLLPEAFATTLDVDDKFHRRNALRVLAARLAREDTDTRRKVLGRALEITAGRDRLDFFYDLSSLVPLLVSVGDDEALRGMIAAVRDCARWWRG